MIRKNYFFFLICIFLFALFLRLYKLAGMPSGFYSDESLTGYEAYSILKTGRDQYGNLLPITFKAFGDYRPGLYIYATVTSVWIFGLTEFATRLPSALFSFLTVIVVFLLSYELFKNYRASIFASALYAVSPWSIQFARMAHDTNLATLLISTAILFFVKGIKKKSVFLMPSLFLFSLAFYVYYTTRVFIPLFLFILLFIFRERLYAKKKHFLVGVLIAFITFLPFVPVLFNQEQGWSRISAVSFWTDPGIKARILQFRSESSIVNDRFSRVFHNKLVDGGFLFLANYFSHFDPQFLLFHGDPVEIYRTAGSGILLLVEPFLLGIAVFYLLKEKYKLNSVLVFWFLIGILPDALTRLTPAAARIHLILPLVSITGGLGMAKLVQWQSKDYYRKSMVAVMIALIIFNIGYFLNTYFVNTPIRYARQWHYGLRELIGEVKQRESRFEKVWVSKTAWGWVNFLFYLQYSPDKFQKEVVLSQKNEYGLGWVYVFGKYFFDDFPQSFDVSRNILYVGEPSEFPKGVIPEHIVYYPDHSEAFYIVSSNAIKQLPVQP